MTAEATLFDLTPAQQVAAGGYVCPHCGETIVNERQAKSHGSYAPFTDLVPVIGPIADQTHRCHFHFQYLCWLALGSAARLPTFMDYWTVEHGTAWARKFGATDDQITAAIEAGEAMR